MAEEDKDYVCTLDLASLKKAKEELNEIAEDRLSAVQALRTWLKEQPHITWPALDTRTLLVYLRGAKFSQIRAREMIEGHLRMRQEAPHWFRNVDTTDSKLQSVLNDGFFFPLPKRDKEGRQLIMQRMGALDPYYKRGYERIDTMRFGIILGNYVQQSEITQVNGSVFIADFTGMTAKHVQNVISNTDAQKWHKKWQKNNPGRFKKFVAYNGGTFIETIFTFMKPFLAKKFQDRMVMCETAESLYKQVPMELLPAEYLPDDYDGPNAGTVNELVENFRKEILKPEFKDFVARRTGDQFGMDESKRSKENDAPTGHFRKLTVE